MLILLTGVWLLSSIVAMFVWARTVRRARGWIETQKARGENGVLRMIALQKFEMASLALAISIVMLSVLFTVLIPQPERQFFGRAALVAITVLFAVMGWQFDRNSMQIMAKIRAEVLRSQGGEAD